MTIIAFEGIDACGKATQVRMLKEHANREGMSTTVLDYPNYSTKTGRKISELLRAPDEERDGFLLQSLMTVNRYENQHYIEHAVSHGHLVILDRYWLSGLVYGQTDGLSISWLLEIHRRLIQPHRWIVLDIPIEASFSRRPDREDYYEANIDRLTNARRLYREAKDTVSDIAIIDANKSPEAVHAEVLRCCEL